MNIIKNWAVKSIFIGLVGGVISYLFFPYWKMSLLVWVFLSVFLIIRNPKRRYERWFNAVLGTLLFLNKITFYIAGEILDLDFRLESNTEEWIVMLGLILFGLVLLRLDFLERNGKELSIKKLLSFNVISNKFKNQYNIYVSGSDTNEGSTIEELQDLDSEKLNSGNPGTLNDSSPPNTAAIEFSFRPDFRADRVSVVDAIHEISRNVESNFSYKINWSKDIEKAINAVDVIYDHARNHLKHESLFYGMEENMILGLINVYSGKSDSIRHIMDDAHKRIPTLIKGMSFERQGVMGCENSITNYLTHCNLDMLRTILYPLTHDKLKNTEFYYKKISSDFDDSLFENAAFYEFVYGIKGNLQRGTIFYLLDENGNELANSNKPALNVVGREEDLRGRPSEGRRFYDEVFVPQIEFQLIGRKDVAFYNYDNRLYLKGNSIGPLHPYL